MWEKIETEIINHCEHCDKVKCEGYGCIVFRIKNIVESIFNPSEINIDDFFVAEDKSQINFFEYREDDEF